jgi:hypothetical protein
VVVLGLTDTDVPLTRPTPWLIDRPVAPLTIHDSVLEPAEDMVLGFAANDEIVGAVTATGTDRVTDPAAFVA